MSERQVPEDTLLVHPTGSPDRLVRISKDLYNQHKAIDGQSKVDFRWSDAEIEESNAPTFDDLTAEERMDVKGRQRTRALEKSAQFSEKAETLESQNGDPAEIASLRAQATTLKAIAEEED